MSPSPTTTSVDLALVSPTHMRFLSRTNPISPLPSLPSVLTVVQMITSFSLPWKASTERTSTSEANSSPSLSLSFSRNTSTWSL